MHAYEPRARHRGFFLHSSDGSEPDSGEHENPEGFVVRMRVPSQSSPRFRGPNPSRKMSQIETAPDRLVSRLYE